MSAASEDLSPSYVREQRITLSLADGVAQADLRASKAVALSVDYSRCEPEGVVCPLQLIVASPSRLGYREQIFTRRVDRVVFTPAEGGVFLVTLREAAHNRWWGCIHLEIKGSTLEPQRYV